MSRHRLFGFAALAVISAWQAVAAPLPDLTYFKCKNAAGDFRISELNHSVSQFSDRYQEYRPVCRECTVTEWGDRIIMRDGDKTFVQVNRLTGDMSIQRNNAAPGAGPFELRSYHGTCVKSTRVVPNLPPPQTSRVF